MAKKKVRVDFRKNRNNPARDNAWTREFQKHGFEDVAPRGEERIRSKGDLSRKRTVIEEDGEAASPVGLVLGRVLRVHGLQSVVEADDGNLYRCAVRRLLKTMATDERNVVTTGDMVWIRPSGEEGMIEKVEPRRGILTRASRRREHVLVANVDQAVIVISLVEPDLKPHLIDRYLACAALGGLTPIVCLNKADRVDAVEYQPLVGGYGQLGITALLTSATTGVGVDRLRRLLNGRASVISGQSGVGKSSLLNAVQPGLGLRVKSVSEVNQKGRHTTTAAELIKLASGGWVVDTPGVRQLQLWEVSPGEVEGFFPEFHALVPRCAFPDCAHIHELGCAVKLAVAHRMVSMRRYTSYVGMYEGAIEARRERS